jgi:predicted dehydrogenase
MKHPKIRYAVVGAGNIAQVAVLPAFEHARENSQLAALISGDAEKRVELARRYELDFVGDYPDLERVLEAGEIDAVYIATPNALHLDAAVRAARQRVHVLCEKPLATSVTDCEAIADACERSEVKLMVAYRLHFEEANLRALEVVRSGQLGDPRIFDSVFTHVVRSGDIRQQAELGGGAMLDLGIYCVNAARTLFGDEPVRVYASAQFRDNVDDTTTAFLQFPHDRVAHFTVGNSCASVSSYRLTGTDGNLRVEPAYEYAGELEHHLTVGEKTSTKRFGKRDQFAPELVYFSRCILDDETPEPSAQEAINDARVIEAVLQSARSGQPVALAPRAPRPGPKPQQEAKKPATDKQKPVNAPSPSLK